MYPVSQLHFMKRTSILTLILTLSIPLATAASAVSEACPLPDSALDDSSLEASELDTVDEPIPLDECGLAGKTILGEVVNAVVPPVGETIIAEGYSDGTGPSEELVVEVSDKGIVEISSDVQDGTNDEPIAATEVSLGRSRPRLLERYRPAASIRIRE